MNEINAVNAVNFLNTNNMNTVTGAQTPAGETFKEIFDSLADSVNRTDSADKALNYDLMTGTLENIHDVTGAAAEADIALRLMASVRNKVIDAYNELMRMQV